MLLNTFLLCAIITSGIATAIPKSEQEIPSSPCPDVFQYQAEPNGDVYGRISLPYDGSSDLQLGVNASMKGYFTNNSQVKLKIKMNTPGQDLYHKKTDELSYDLYFPFQNIIPKITKIEYNHKTFCVGPPEDVLPGGPGMTSLWTRHNYYFKTEGNADLPSNSTKPSLPKENVLTTVAQNRRYPETTVAPLHSYRLKVDECGVSKNTIVPLILGGSETKDGEFPWLVAMFTANGNGYDYKCTANLISDRHVITAGRCVNFFKLQVVSTEDILLIFGKSNLKNWATNGAVIRGSLAVKTYPEYDANSGHGDITVITLDKPVEFSQFIAPICLWEGDNSLGDVVDKTGTIAGWGADEGAYQAGRYSTPVAKSVNMPIVSQDKCLFSNLSYFQLTSDLTFCAGKRDGAGVCIGDSGAGFMINKNGKYYLRGLASLVLGDKGKCDLNHFMVFCDAAKLTHWIKQCMK